MYGDDLTRLNKLYGEELSAEDEEKRQLNVELLALQVEKEETSLNDHEAHIDLSARITDLQLALEKLNS